MLAEHYAGYVRQGSHCIWRSQKRCHFFRKKMLYTKSCPCEWTVKGKHECEERNSTMIFMAMCFCNTYLQRAYLLLSCRKCFECIQCVPEEGLCSRIIVSCLFALNCVGTLSQNTHYTCTACFLEIHLPLSEQEQGQYLVTSAIP